MIHEVIDSAAAADNDICNLKTIDPFLYLVTDLEIPVSGIKINNDFHS